MVVGQTRLMKYHLLTTLEEIAPLLTAGSRGAAGGLVSEGTEPNSEMDVAFRDLLKTVFTMGGIVEVTEKHNCSVGLAVSSFGSI